MDDGYTQFNIRVPRALKLEIMAYAKANRQMLQFAAEDLLRAGLGDAAPGRSKSKKVTIHKRKSAVPAARRQPSQNPKPEDQA